MSEYFHNMDTAHWLQTACDDAERRGLAGLRPLLETLARSTAALRDADLVARSAADTKVLLKPDATDDATEPDTRHRTTPGGPTE